MSDLCFVLWAGKEAGRGCVGQSRAAREGLAGGGASGRGRAGGYGAGPRGIGANRKGPYPSSDDEERLCMHYPGRLGFVSNQA